MKAWCVQHREGWCACSAQVRPPKPSLDSVRTKCRHYVMFPWGVEWRTPDCKDCRAEGEAVMREDAETVYRWLAEAKAYRYSYTGTTVRRVVERLVAEGRAEWLSDPAISCRVRALPSASPAPKDKKT